MANKINVLECGPRDGWQNLKQMLTFEQKLDLIDRLFDAGVTQMEVTSFVSPKAIPQMADAADLAKACIEKYPNADVTELAGEMLKGVLRGRALVQGGVKGMSWNLRFGLGEDGMLSAEDSARVFNPERNTPYQMLLVYPTGSVDQNQLLFAVAAYNFANFMVKEFDWLWSRPARSVCWRLKDLLVLMRLSNIIR